MKKIKDFLHYFLQLTGHIEFETTDFYYIHVSEERKKTEFEKVLL